MRHRSAFLVGECGTGKTLMGAVAAHLAHGRSYRALVVGPPHLTKRSAAKPSKWAREIEATLPGVRVIHLDKHRKLLRLPSLLAEETRPVWVVTSRNFLKMGPPVRPAFNVRRVKVEERDGYRWAQAPTCPSCGEPVMDSDGVPRPMRYLHSARRRCDACESPLWQYTWPTRKGSGAPSREKPVFLPADWMKGRLRFDVGIFDEVHELKGGGTAQGKMLGSVASCCDKVFALTGTLFGGKASDLYYLMWRLCPERMRALGFDYHGGLSAFVDRYGIRQRIIEQDGAVRGVRSKRSNCVSVCEKPGIVPALFTDLLLDKAAFLSLDEMVPHLPDAVLPPRPRIEVVRCSLGELEPAYKPMHETIIAEVKRTARVSGLPNMGLLSFMFAGLDCWPDYPFDWDPVMKCVGIDEETGERAWEEVLTPPSMPDDAYEKDRRLVEIVQREVRRGRRCIVYTVHTVKHPVGERIRGMLELHGIRAAVLGDGVDTSKREEWVARQEADGVQVIITHPGKVETGLDLLGWPTIIFHSIGCKPFTFRQAGARAWRIGQTQRCRVIILCYADTMQEMIARIMFDKLKASTRLEGQILDDLSSIGDSDDIQDQILKAIQDGEDLRLDEVEDEFEDEAGLEAVEPTIVAPVRPTPTSRARPERQKARSPREALVAERAGLEAMFAQYLGGTPAPVAASADDELAELFAQYLAA